MVVFKIFSLALSLAVASAIPQQRIVGGSTTTITAYPFSASLLYSKNFLSYNQRCGGTIILSSVVLTAANCVNGDSTNRWRIRVGSNYANSGGNVYGTSQIIVHYGYNTRTYDSDVALLRSSGTFIYSSYVSPAVIAGSSYYLADNQPLWAIGWGVTSAGGSAYEQLRHVQIFAVNQNICKTNYASLGNTITDNMLCAGWLNVGGRDQCQGDAGSPLLHNSVVVGICSWGYRCAEAKYPGVSARVSRFTNWIQSNV